MDNSVIRFIWVSWPARPIFLCCHSSSWIYLSVWLSWQVPGLLSNSPNLGYGQKYNSGWGPSHNDEKEKDCQNPAPLLGGRRSLGQNQCWMKNTLKPCTKALRDYRLKYTQCVNSRKGEAVYQKVWTGIWECHERKVKSNRKSLCKTKISKREREIHYWAKDHCVASSNGTFFSTSDFHGLYI